MKQPTDHLAMPTYQVGILQSKAHRALTASMTDALKKYDLSMPLWAVLGVLNDEVESRPFKISEKLGVRPPVVTALINDLERMQLVTRKPHITDNRATVVVLTRRGRAYVTKIESRLHKKLHSFMGDLTVPELALYIRVLTKISMQP